MEWYVLLGISNGMRTMTPMAVLCWFNYLGLLPHTRWSVWSANLITAIVFTIFAVGEWYGDTRPNIGSRTSPPQLISRLIFGGVAGALAALSISEPIVGGVLFAWAGVFIGAFAGVRLRLWLANKVGRDLPVALCESALALALALTAAWMLHLSNQVAT